MGEINGQNMIRKYNGMMNKDLEFKKETEEKKMLLQDMKLHLSNKEKRHSHRIWKTHEVQHIMTNKLKVLKRKMVDIEGKTI